MPDKPTAENPAREELIQRIQAALENAQYIALFLAVLALERK